MAGKTESASIRFPYKNLKDDAAEVEMVGVVDVDIGSPSPNHRIDLNSSSSPPPPSSSPPLPGEKQNCSLATLVLSCTIAAGVQFGWALQLSLLTPYIQVHSLSLSLYKFVFVFVRFGSEELEID